MTETDRCKGHCCMDIGLPVSPEELEQSYYRWLIVHHGAKDDIKMSISHRELRNQYGVIEDIWLLYPMLEFVKKDKIHPDGGVTTDMDVYHYTCKHFKGGNCQIYAFRPTLCRMFPAGYCGYADCQCKKYTDARPEGWRYGMTIKEFNKPNDDAREKKSRLSELDEDAPIEEIPKLKEDSLK